MIDQRLFEQFQDIGRDIFDAGLTREQVEKVLGANVRRVLAANLPP